MNTRWPSAVSSLHSITIQRNASPRCLPLLRTQHTLLRHYSTPSPPNHPSTELKRHEKAALVQIKGLKRLDPVDPPESTRPPPLNLPERGDKNIAAYYFRIGRAYGSFYWVGIKAVWFNYRAAKALKGRVRQLVEADDQKEQTAWLKHLNRSEFQLLERNNYDIGKLPFFGLLVCLFGEWLPLIVPFIPSVVPGTCRIPKQIQGMRAKAEERRRVSFRKGISEPSKEQIPAEIPEHLEQSDWPMVQQEYARLVLDRFRDDQLYHLSCTLNNHSRLWDRVQLPPPSSLLRRGLSRQLAYLARDDHLLSRDGGISRLSPDEVTIACEERGIDVLGKRGETLRQALSWWLARQKDDRGRGHALFTMLFRRLAIRDWVRLHLDANEADLNLRPNAWNTKT